jgi:hypothetical protein
MNIRKIAAAATFATGAALAFAPLASATPLVDPTLVTDTLGSEVASLNGTFQFDALLAGVPSTDYLPNGVHGVDTIIPQDVVKDVPLTGTPSTLDYELYGVNPFAAGVSGDSSAGNELNGALLAFENAYNVELYSGADGGTLDTNINDYLFSGFTQTVLGTTNETTTQAFDALYNRGIGDLGGFFQTNLSFLDITPAAVPGEAVPAAVVPITSTLTSEVQGLNSLFASDVAAAGINADKIVDGTGLLPFDTIATTDANSTLDTLLFGFNPASVSGDPGAYDVLNGSLGEFANAYNVELFSLLNGGDILPVADLIGTHADLLNGTVSEALSGFFQLGLSDLAGYF